ncbi:pyridoxine 5'-phosphate synthase [Gemmatimonas sp.]|jgi:pyridoxine 5-phosphate synthase|uniref:pyridoxine 5'-phosphate synthase n=1 Tax=Gemmatimonas sp. TaxID=1962908 RepID=UPI0037BE96CA
MSLRYQRLYVNIDHVATVRQARRSQEPDPVAAATLCEQAGADGITAHLREDRRHIQDDDIHRLAAAVTTLLNLECAITDDMLTLAETLRPAQVTLVPERREEITTEGGLDVIRHEAAVRDAVTRLKRLGIRTSLFIDPDASAVTVSHAVGAEAIELHTGAYAHAPRDPATLRALREAAALGASLGLAVHAGHGLSVNNVGPVAAIPEIEELNIGHAIVGRAIFVGLDAAVREVRAAMDEAREADLF